MLKKHLVLIGISVALLLLLAATWTYPGGSQFDPNAPGFDWKNNYLSNLFGSDAVNGAANPARYWAIPGVFFLCLSFGYFFFEFSKKIPTPSAARIIRFLGIGAMACAFLAVTPLHDLAITLAGTVALVSMFYITVFVFKTRLHALKLLSVLCLLSAYGCNYVYYLRSHLEWLPVLQKISLIIMIAWVLCLQYFTKAADFQSPSRPETPA